ncbi:hypothetical protein Desde_0152 [Desulfitobacterium dehalogenans ATCC 51507]|uniref:Uncharacterized protein n=1 Tax=Desulfitobacterium dehalogenans (strain ATCC 51507 / DSM 9161 / JW/IU-DC1) TaxID=756499 RepID=I4A3V6_DESDJ|nr:hypothetical protein Desde_0152 [Desulfitobacterium dehalogenans ATCC 51507]
MLDKLHLDVKSGLFVLALLVVTVITVMAFTG